MRDHSVRQGRARSSFPVRESGEFHNCVILGNFSIKCWVKVLRGAWGSVTLAIEAAKAATWAKRCRLPNYFDFLMVTWPRAGSPSLRRRGPSPIANGVVVSAGRITKKGVVEGVSELTNIEKVLGVLIAEAEVSDCFRRRSRAARREGGRPRAGALGEPIREVLLPHSPR